MKKGGSSSVQGTKATKSDLLRTLIPSLIAAEKYAHQRRPEDAQGVRPEELLRQPLRSIIIGRSLNQRLRTRQNRVLPKMYYTGAKVILDPVRGIQGQVTICRKRALRRESLFALEIAGRGLRKSPGQGGSYKRNQFSLQSCITRRR